MKLNVVNNHEVLMSWDGTDENLKYLIEWSVGAEDQKAITISHNLSYTFTNLQPGQIIRASVQAVHPNGKYGGPLSNFEWVVLPGGL